MTWKDIINSIPESLATAILTATFTGLLLLYFKNRIESSFARKLEEFRVGLQKSVIEHQIKYSRTYPKTLEILEALHEKILHYRGLVFLLAEDTTSGGKPSDRIKNIEDEVSSVLADSWFCLESNRIRLPDLLVIKIEDIIQKADTLSQLLMASRYFSKTPNPHLAKLLNKTAKRDGLNISEIDPKERFHVFTYTEQIKKEILELSLQFENLYKSVAEAK